MKTFLLTSAGLLLGAGSGIAATAFSLPAGTSGSQNFAGTLGMDFTVNPGFSIIVDRLGTFEDDSNGFDPGTSILVNLWSRSDSGTPGIYGDDTGIAPLRTATFSAANPGIADGAFNFQSAAPLVLTAGEYTIVADGYNSNDQNGNFGLGSPPSPIDDGGGAITFVGTSRFGLDGTGTFPATIDTGPANRYYAGNFSFTVVPETGAAGLITLGALTLGLRRRKR